MGTSHVILVTNPLLVMNEESSDYDQDKWNISVASLSLLAATLCEGNNDRNYKLWNIGSTDKIYTPYAGAAGMLLQINGKFTMGNLKSSLLL